MSANDIKSVLSDLDTRNYPELLRDLRRIGRPIKKAWHAKLLRESNKTSEKYKFTSNKEFKEFLVSEIEKFKPAESAYIEDVPQYIAQLEKQLSELALFLTVWKDDPNLQESESGSLPTESTEFESKRLRQEIKFKASLGKDDRYAINIALQTMVFILCQKSNNTVKSLERKENYPKDHALSEDEYTKNFQTSQNKQALVDFIKKHINSLNKIESDRYLRVIKEESPLIQQETIEKMGKAIAAFQTPNKKKKLLKYFGILLALIASLACGLATGGAIILLFPSLSITAFILGGVIAFFGFKANFGYFSKNFPDFILSLVKKGGISEYIDSNGKRKQFSAIYKYLLTPLAIFSSLTVGAGVTALTYMTVLGLVGKLLPILAVIWPSLPLIIVGLLAAAVGLALTVAVLTSTLELLKNVAASNLGFKTLCGHASEKCINWFKNLKHLKTHEKVGLVIMIALLPIALAGLAYFRYTAGVDLSAFIGVAGAIVMGIVAYIPQMAFTYLSLDKFKNILTTPTPKQTESNPAPKRSLLSQLKSVFSAAWYWLGLSINAVGNAVLVYKGSALSIAGAVACGLNSLTGTISTPDMNQHHRKEATSKLYQEYEGFIPKPKEKLSTETAKPTANAQTPKSDDLGGSRERVTQRSKSVEDQNITSGYSNKELFFQPKSEASGQQNTEGPLIKFSR